MLNINFEMLDAPIPLGGVTSLVVENKPVFATLIQNLHAYTEDMLDIRIFDKKQNQLKTDELMLVMDVLGYEVNTAATLRHIYSDAENHISQDPAAKTAIEDMLGGIYTIIYRALIDFIPDLAFNPITLTKAFKALDMQVEVAGNTFLERMTDIIQVFKYLRKKKLLAVVNLGAYLSPQEMAQVVEYARLQNITLLLLDNAPFVLPPEADQFILDKRLCAVWHKSVSKKMRETLKKC